MILRRVGDTVLAQWWAPARGVLAMRLDIVVALGMTRGVVWSGYMDRGIASVGLLCSMETSLEGNVEIRVSIDMYVLALGRRERRDDRQSKGVIFTRFVGGDFSLWMALGDVLVGFIRGEVVSSMFTRRVCEESGDEGLLSIDEELREAGVTSKANVVADALSRKKWVKPKRVQAMAMTI
ncbi:hypothetical protein Tco_0890253 [Tanacetum coccineum]|uniref:Uncharacterized protein n=1 Tax=Tanacetum coccineum TaxID=301880 RepID=A0ABQ5BZK0_9ASTR